MTKYAFLDFDGTLRRGFLMIDVGKRLVKLGLHSRGSYRKQLKLAALAKSGKITYATWLVRWAKLWAEGFRGIDSKKTERAIAQAVKVMKKDIYPSSYTLIAELRRQGFVPVVVSAGDYLMAREGAMALGIKTVFGTKLGVRSGRFNGKLINSIYRVNGKRKEILGLASKKELAQSFAFGDAVADSEMLELVGRPVALNPSPSMAALARKRGWLIATSKTVASKVRKAGSNKYKLIRQKPYCCVPASLSMALERRGIKHGGQADLGYELGLTLPPKKRLECLFPRARFTIHPPSWGYGTRVPSKKYSITAYFKRHKIKLNFKYLPPEKIMNLTRSVSENIRKGNDVLVCFNNKMLYGGKGDWGHVCVIEGASAKAIKLVDPDNPPYLMSVKPSKLMRAIRHHGRKNYGGLWIISKIS